MLPINFNTNAIFSESHESVNCVNGSSALFFAVLFDFFFIQYSNIAVPKHFVLVPNHPLNIRLMRTHTHTRSFHTYLNIQFFTLLFGGEEMCDTG